MHIHMGISDYCHVYIHFGESKQLQNNADQTQATSINYRVLGYEINDSFQLYGRLVSNPAYISVKH